MNGKTAAFMAIALAILALVAQAIPIYEADLTPAERETFETLLDKVGKSYIARMTSGVYVKRANAELVNGLLGMRYGDLMRAG